MEHNTIKGAVIDLDGTLLDSLGVWYTIDRELLGEYNITPPKDISEIVKSMTIEESSNYFIERFHLPLTAEEIAKKVEEMAAYQYKNVLQLKETGSDFLAGLDKMGIKYGIATATYPALARAALDRLGLSSRIQFLITEEELHMSKTQPQIYMEGAKRLGLGKRQILVAEDALHCILTAKKAGFFTAGVYDPMTSFKDWGEICANATISVKKISDIINLIF